MIKEFDWKLNVNRKLSHLISKHWHSCCFLRDEKASF